MVSQCSNGNGDDNCNGDFGDDDDDNKFILKCDFKYALHGMNKNQVRLKME